MVPITETDAKGLFLLSQKPLTAFTKKINVFLWHPNDFCTVFDLGQSSILLAERVRQARKPSSWRDVGNKGPTETQLCAENMKSSSIISTRQSDRKCGFACPATGLLSKQKIVFPRHPGYSIYSYPCFIARNLA